jgi:CHAT domain-containing protein
MFGQCRRFHVTLDFGANAIVHFATHGLINNKHAQLSGIVLSLVDERGQPQNGFLRLYEIYNLHLKSDSGSSLSLPDSSG